MNYIIENIKKLYLENKKKVNTYFTCVFSFTLLYYNPYLFLNLLIV